MSACEPSTSWLIALPMSCSSAARFVVLTPALELGGHDPAEVDDLERVLEDVLAVARAVAEPPEDLDELLVELAAVRLEHRLLAGLQDVLLELRLRLVVHLLDPRRVDAAVLDQLVERERATSRRSGSNDERTTACGVSSMMKSTPGQVLERADVAPLAADDAPLEVVRCELDHRDRRLGRVARSDALERVRDEGPSPPSGSAAGLLLHLADVACELVADEILRALEQLLPRLVDGEPRDALERRRAPPSAPRVSSSWSAFTCTSRSPSPCSLALERRSASPSTSLPSGARAPRPSRSGRGGPGPRPRSRCGAATACSRASTWASRRIASASRSASARIALALRFGGAHTRARPAEEDEQTRRALRRGFR